jgi:hypothetical protein
MQASATTTIHSPVSICHDVPMDEKMPDVAEAAGEQAARDQAAQEAERALIAERGGVSATSNESGVPVNPGTVVDSGDRNFVTGEPGTQPVLAAEPEGTPGAFAEVLNVPEAAGPDGEVDAQGKPEPPAKSASKGDWVEYAVDMGMSMDEAEAKTKDDLIEEFGG